ncbi:MAG: response regulator [Acidobacteriota bacterium]
MNSLSSDPGRRPNLLVVDDEESVCCLLHEMFAELGYHTELAMSGEDALQKAQHIPFDVVLTDVSLPGISGLDLVRALHGRIPASEIILMTGFLTLDMSLEAIREGVADLITKPIVSLDAVLKSVEKVLDRHKRRVQVAVEDSESLAHQTETLFTLCTSMTQRLAAVPAGFFLSECAEHVGRVLLARRVEFDLGVPGEDLPRMLCWPAGSEKRRPRAERRETVTQPITLGERTLGILRVIGPDHAPTRAELDFLTAVGNMAALCLERAELREEREASFVRFLEYLVQMRESLAGFEEGHSRRVADLAERLGRFLGFTQRGLNQLRRAALFHDLGKLGVDPELLNRPGPLNPAELEAVRRSREITERLLGATSCLEDVRHILVHLGTGGSSEHKPTSTGVPLESRILTVAAAYTAMTSRRPHRPALSAQNTLEEMHREAGVRFDPDMIQALEMVLQDSSTGASREAAGSQAEDGPQEQHSERSDASRTVVVKAS